MGESALTGIVGPVPVGTPGLAALLVGLLLFVGAVAFVQWRVHRAGGSRAAASAHVPSRRGMLLQAIGFVLVALGPVKPTLQAGSAASLGQAVAVAILMSFCIGLFATAAFALQNNWSFAARTRRDHDLVTWGPFATIRHPIYAGLFAALLAFAIAFGHWRGFLVGFPFFCYGTWMRVSAEERLLRERFGHGYERYAARVKRFIPKLF